VRIAARQGRLIIGMAVFFVALFFSLSLHAQQVRCVGNKIQIDRRVVTNEVARQRLVQSERRLKALEKSLKSLQRKKPQNQGRIAKTKSEIKKLKSFIRQLELLLRTCSSATPTSTPTPTPTPVPPGTLTGRFDVQSFSFSDRRRLLIFRSKSQIEGIEATHLNDGGTVALRVFDSSRFRGFNFLGGELYTYSKGAFSTVCGESDCHGDRTANFIDLSPTGNALYRTASVDLQTGLDSAVRFSFFNPREALKEKQRIVVSFNDKLQDEPSRLVDRLGFIVAKSSSMPWPDMWDYRTGVSLRGPDLLSFVERDLVQVEDDLLKKFGYNCVGERGRDFQNQQLFINEQGETVSRFNSIVTCETSTGRFALPAISGLLRAVGSTASLVASTIYAPGLYESNGVRGPLSVLQAVSEDGTAVMTNPPTDPDPEPSRLRQAFVVKGDRIEIVDVNFAGVDKSKLEDESNKLGILGFPPASVNNDGSFVGTRLLFYKQGFRSSENKASEAYLSFIKDGVREVKNVDELFPRSSNIETLSAAEINSCGAIAGGARETGTGRLVGYILVPQTCDF
jgi:hypothetical protein